MRTRSSPPQSEDGGVIIESAAGSRPRCEWSPEDIIRLIDFLIENKSNAGDAAMFRQSVWNAAAVKLAETHGSGGPKTDRACKEKWIRVCRTAFQ